MPRKRLIPAQPRSMPLSAEEEDRRVKLLAGMPLSEDGLIDWRTMQDETTARFFCRELLWAEGQAARFVGIHGTGSAAPWAERTHRVAYHDYQAMRGEFCNDGLFAQCAGEARADDPGAYQSSAADLIDDHDGAGDQEDDPPTPTDAYWDDLRDEMGTWLRKAATKYDPARGSWRPFLRLYVEDRVKDFLDHGKRKPKGAADRADPVIAGMVDRTGEKPDREQQAYSWIERNMRQPKRRRVRSTWTTTPLMSCFGPSTPRTGPTSIRTYQCSTITRAV